MRDEDYTAITPDDPLFPRAGYVNNNSVEAYVDTSAYGLDGWRWCVVTGCSVGSASVYPLKVDVPGRGKGQYRLDEARGFRMTRDTALLLRGESQVMRAAGKVPPLELE